mgnify:CR=1 FL=1
MSFESINNGLRLLAEILNHSASIALKLITIGILIIAEQWLDQYL